MTAPSVVPTPGVASRGVGAQLTDLVGRVRARLLRSRAGGPSYLDKLEGARRTSRIAGQLGTREPVWDINDKLSAYEWVDRLGVRRPVVHGQFSDIGAVDWSSLPDRCVLKPVSGAGSLGVHLLERRGTAWQELRAARSVTPEQVRTAVRNLAEENKVSAQVIVEELVDDPQRPGAAPVDWKFYTFFGHVSIVQARAHVHGTDGRGRVNVKIFDTSWRDLGSDSYLGSAYDASIPPPRNGAALMSMAARISAAVPRAFLRVDLYEDEEGPVFGEITPYPGGGQRFRRDIDRMLGACWEESEARLLVRGARAGVLSPATVELPESATVLRRATNGPGPA